MQGNVVSEADIVSSNSVWTRDSEMRVRVRKLGTRTDRIVIDITELTYKKTSRSRAVWAAANAARLQQYSTDPILLSDNEIEKKIKDGDGKIHVVRIRHSVFMFGEI